MTKDNYINHAYRFYMFLILVVFFVLFIPQTLNAQPTDDNSYTLGIFPYLPPARTEKIFSPVAEAFQNALDRPIHLRSSGTFDQFSKDLKKEKYDIVFLQPFFYVWAHDEHNYLPLAKRTNSLRTIFIALKESDLQSITDMNNKVLATPPLTAAVSRMAKKALLKHNLKLDKEVQVIRTRNHLSCFQKVLLREADACSTAPEALKFVKKKLGDSFKVIHTTPAIAHSLYAVHSRVPKAQREALKQNIVNWRNTEHGKLILQNGRFSPFIEAHDKDYDSVRNFWK